MLFIGVGKLAPGQYDFTLQDSIKVDCNHFTTDNLGNIYLYKNDELKKLNKKGAVQFTYSNKLLGTISYVDASNPMRILIFYKGISQIVITDNTLSVQGQSIELENLNLYQTQVVANSYLDNGIWTYDQELFQLIKLNTQFEREFESGNLEQLIGITNLTPTQIEQENGFVYMTCPNNGILVFDIYGTYYKTIPITNIDKIQVLKHGIFYQKEGQFYFHQFKSFESSPIEMPLKQHSDVRIGESNIFILAKDQILIYDIVEK